MIDRDQRTLTLTLTLVDNDGVFDLDSTSGNIGDPVGIAVPVAADAAQPAPENAGGGGGGCALRTDLQWERYDFSLVILMLMAGIYAGIARRRRIKGPHATPD